MKLKYIIIIGSVFLVLLGFKSNAQMPEITVRFANPVIDMQNLTYSLDVELQSDTEMQQLFGMNVRFFYNDDQLEFDSFSDFQGGYGQVQPNPIKVRTAPAISSNQFFALVGKADFINGAIQFVNTSAAPIHISTSAWTKIYSVNFNIDPSALTSSKFFPSVIWDLQEIEDKGGFTDGDEGVVITLLSDDFNSESVPAFEKAKHHNWHYDGISGYPYGYPGVNAPVAVNDFNSTFKNTPVATNVTINDYHLEGAIVPGSLSIGTASNGLLKPTNGKLQLNAQSGEITYFPRNGFSGVDTYEYEIGDEEGNKSIALVTIFVVSELETSNDKESGAFDESENAVLYQNLPNPFKSETTIKFYIPQATLVKLSIYDAIGELVEDIVNEQLSEGEYEYIFNAENYRIGTYFYKLTTNDEVFMKPMNLVK